MRRAYAEKRQVAAKAHDDFKKYEIGKDPLEKEDEIQVIQPLGGDEGKQFLKLLRRLLKEKRKAGDQYAAEANAVQFRIASFEAEQLHGRVQKEFARDFVMWLHGRGKQKDHDKSWWGRSSLLDDPEVRSYCHMFTVKRTEYLLKLTRLANRRPMGINEHFLFFKYIVRNEPLDQISFHADSKLLLDETLDAIKKDPASQHPVRDAPHHHEVPPFDKRQDRARQREDERDNEQVSIIYSDDEGDYNPGSGNGRGGPRGDGGEGGGTDEELRDAPDARPPPPPPQQGPRRSTRPGRYQGDYSERGGRRRNNDVPTDGRQPMDEEDDGEPANDGIDEERIGTAVAGALKPMFDAILSGLNRPPPPPNAPTPIPVMNFPQPAAPNVNVNVPQQPAPVVNVPAPNVSVNVPQQPAPVVNVPAPVVNVPQQPAPIVNVPAPIVNVPQQPAPVVNVAAPIVNPTPVHVNVPAPVVNYTPPAINIPRQEIPAEIMDAFKRTNDYGTLRAELEKEKGERHKQAAGYERSLKDLYEKLQAKSKGPGVTNDDKNELDRMKNELAIAREREALSARVLKETLDARAAYMDQMQKNHDQLIAGLNNRDANRTKVDADLATALDAIGKQLGNLKGNTANGQTPSVDLGPLTQQIGALIGKLEGIATKDPGQIPSLQDARQKELEAQVINLMGQTKNLEDKLKLLGDFMNARDRDNAERNQRVNEALIRGFNEAVGKIQAGQKGAAPPPANDVIKNMPSLSPDQMTSLIGGMKTLTDALNNASMRGKNIPAPTGPTEADIIRIIGEKTKDSRDLINKLTNDLAKANTAVVDSANQLNNLRARLQAAEAANASGASGNAALGDYVKNLQAQLNAQNDNFNKLLGEARAEAAKAREDAKAAEKDAKNQIERLERELDMAQADLDNIVGNLKDQIAAMANAPPSQPPSDKGKEEMQGGDTDVEDAKDVATDQEDEQVPPPAKKKPVTKKSGKGKSKPGMEIKVGQKIDESDVKAAVAGLEEETPVKNDKGKREKETIEALVTPQITDAQLKEALETKEGKELEQISADLQAETAKGQKVDLKPFLKRFDIVVENATVPLKVPKGYRRAATPEQVYAVMNAVAAQLSEQKFNLVRGGKRSKAEKQAASVGPQEI